MSHLRTQTPLLTAHTPTTLPNKQVSKEPATQDWQLFLVDWGYNTQRERESARANPRISVVGLDGFQSLLQG
jgi:hypothetical protein